MILLSLLTPFLISFSIGYLLIDSLFRNEKKPDLLVHGFLAGGLGLGISAFLTFFSFVLFDSLNKSFSLSANLILLILLFFEKFLAMKRSKTRAFNFKSMDIKTTSPFILILIALIPLWIQAKFYPMGGWDAWSVWNFKAKFLLLAGDKWQNLLDPILWRSSPHYPLLLPLINVWGWIFMKTALSVTPLITSVLFTFLTTGLLFATLRHLTKNFFAVAAPLLLLTLPFYGTLATSQYCDIIIGYFVLSSLYCLLEGMKRQSCSFALLSGLFLGILSFSKPEGMVIALLIACLGSVLFIREKGMSSFRRRKILAVFLISAFLSSLPTIIFQILYSPGNQTFVNGFFSLDKPVTLYRLKMILAFLVMELKSSKWNCIWILSAVGIILSWGKCFRKGVLVFPLFLALYMGITLIYYFTNTYFEIKWWLQSSLNRVLFSLLPTVLFWIFYSLWQEET